MPHSTDNLKLRIYNLSGELVTEYSYGAVAGGFSYIYSWDGKNKDGSDCASGVYFAIADANNSLARHKIAILR